MQASVSLKWQPPTGTLGELTRQAEIRANAIEPLVLELVARAKAQPTPLSFAAALRGNSVKVITEIKRSSPSKGVIAERLDAVQQAHSYVKGGAAAISVLTEPEKFGGSLADLQKVASAVGVPILRKDFIVHPAQIWEARANGAAAVLLIVRALSPSQLGELLTAADEAGLATLVEVRDEVELEHAVNAGAQIIGVNNRNLETLQMDVSTAPRIIAQIPPHIIAVAESGMTSGADLVRPARAGADAVLVGSAISAASDPEAAVRALAGVPRVAR